MKNIFKIATTDVDSILREYDKKLKSIVDESINRSKRGDNREEIFHDAQHKIKAEEKITHQKLDLVHRYRRYIFLGTWIAFMIVVMVVLANIIY